jgi:murein L,D-transpeptidase YcbB/YkuD
MRHSAILVFLLIFVLQSTAVAGFSGFASDAAFHNKRLTDSFYTHNNGQLFWFHKDGLAKRNALLSIIGNCQILGLSTDRYNYEALLTDINSEASIVADRLFTDAAITFYKDLYQGYGVTEPLGEDQISKKYTASDESLILERLSRTATPHQLIALAQELQPSTNEYKLLIDELRTQIDAGNKRKAQQLSRAVNFYRWIHHFRFQKFIVVNAGSALLKYYEGNDKKLEMKVVVGKPSTRTPRFAAYCNEVILYPYWNVPYSIATKEILPKAKKDISVLDAMDLQMINKSGAIVNPRSINWAGLSAGNFPYRLRQSTGCDNALGVLKFNLTAPYAVYLHDTDVKSVFKSKRRYFSHGCIRVERPMDLANYLLPERVDEKFLEACVKDQKPVVKQLKEPVPVFVIYTTVEVSDTVGYYPDTYKLEL